MWMMLQFNAGQNLMAFGIWFLFFLVSFNFIMLMIMMMGKIIKILNMFRKQLGKIEPRGNVAN